MLDLRYHLLIPFLLGSPLMQTAWRTLRQCLVSAENDLWTSVYFLLSPSLSLPVSLFLSLVFVWCYTIHVCLCHVARSRWSLDFFELGKSKKRTVLILGLQGEKSFRNVGFLTYLWKSARTENFSCLYALKKIKWAFFRCFLFLFRQLPHSRPLQERANYLPYPT